MAKIDTLEIGKTYHIGEASYRTGQRPMVGKFIGIKSTTKQVGRWVPQERTVRKAQFEVVGRLTSDGLINKRHQSVGSVVTFDHRGFDPVEFDVEEWNASVQVHLDERKAMHDEALAGAPADLAILKAVAEALDHDDAKVPWRLRRILGEENPEVTLVERGYGYSITIRDLLAILKAVAPEVGA